MWLSANHLAGSQAPRGSNHLAGSTWGYLKRAAQQPVPCQNYIWLKMIVFPYLTSQIYLMVALLFSLLRLLLSPGNVREIALENLALRQQLAVMKRQCP